MSAFFLSMLASSMVQGAADDLPPSPPVQTEPSSGVAVSEHGDFGIVVTGERGDELDAANRLPKVIVGSRIPQRGVQNNPHIASATSLGGLTPSSGMDAFKNDSSARWTSCKVAGFSVSSDVGCALRNASRAMQAADWQAARAVLAGLTITPGVSLDGQYLTHRMLFQVATSTGDGEARRRALAGMVDTGLMGARDERAALRTLATMAKRAGDTDDAITRYRELIGIDADDYQSRINLGSLLREQQNDTDAKTHFLAAIVAMERLGVVVPDNLRLAVQ